MGRGGPINWPARSPDLNVLDFFVWSHIKTLIEHWCDGTENKVREAIAAAFNTITPEMAHRATSSVVRRAELCVQQRGGHFEQLLHLQNENGLLWENHLKKRAMLSTAMW
ncbi:uncharacterized protein LOC118646151 [Monomorium pharaonis]|uniref:uncharacterized protein LOC118646151 n=1 Tax=Monomorium pharaonis TaxID=307658 RepID=UPI00174773B7|nr:uncharacterized protein LOC118646151 [Monomorium pharaonis]